MSAILPREELERIEEVLDTEPVEDLRRDTARLLAMVREQIERLRAAQKMSEASERMTT